MTTTFKGWLCFAALSVVLGGVQPTQAGDFKEVAELRASDATTKDFFGRGVDISGDTIVVGAEEHQTATQFFFGAGSAYVFQFDGTAWTEQAKLTASDARIADLFGIKVGIGGDTIVVGASGNDDSGSFSGSAYVFQRNGTTWTEQVKLTASDAFAGSSFGHDVDIDGNMIVVGAPFGGSPGAAYVFQFDGTDWTEQAKLTASDAAAFDQFGFSVDISGDTIVVAARRDDDLGTDSGSAYIFQRTGTTWIEQAKLTANDGAAGDLFGIDVSIDLDTAMVGALFGNAVYVFQRSGTAWTEQAKLTVPNSATFAHVSIDGDTALLADPHVNDATGAAYIFQRTGTSWTQHAKLTASDGAALDRFGSALAIEGRNAVMGSAFHHGIGPDSGSAYVFVSNPAIAALEQLIGTVMSFNLQQGIENGLDAKLFAIIMALDDVSNNNDGAAINMLVAFIQNAEAQRGHSLTDAQADQLIAEAQAIIDLLNS